MRRLIFVLLAVLMALAVASISPGRAGQHQLRLLYRDSTSQLTFPLEWYTLEDWVRLPGDPVAAPEGGYRLPFKKVAEDILLIEPGQFWTALSSLTASPPNATVDLPSDARLLVHWTPGAGVVTVENAAFLPAGTAPERSRMARVEVAWPLEEAAAKPRNRVPPKELQQCIVAHDPGRIIFSQSSARASLGFVTITPASLTFSAMGELVAGSGTGEGWLLVAEESTGEVWLWYADA